jgi:hypothetical protein
MAQHGPTEDAETNRVTRPWGGWTPSRGFWVGMATVGLFSMVLVAAGAFASGREPQAAAPGEPAPVIAPPR